ncbi:ABC transporter permease [Plantactinospora sp. GCM10030261]|uniref:ABC transporter permease n=1 Tax=Plantactinospora sp. GCM10030261 TaxID=3273420 RepID=UPI00361AE673
MSDQVTIGAAGAAAAPPARAATEQARPKAPRIGTALGYAGAAYLVLLVALAAAAPLVVPVGPEVQDLRNQHLPPAFLGGDWSHPLGTDKLGRDLFSRLVYGSRVSLTIGVGAVAVSAVAGTLLGLVAGYGTGVGSRLGTLLDRGIMLLTEMALAIPAVLLAIAVSAVFGTNQLVLVLILSLFGWVVFARVVRGALLSLHGRGFVEAARVLGAGHLRIVYRHMYPHVVGQILVIAPLQIGFMILVETALGYLGLGIPPPAPTWGNMVAEGRLTLSASPWTALLAGLAITATVLSVNFVGDLLRRRTAAGRTFHS